jgi:hypothetical protein
MLYARQLPPPALSGKVRAPTCHAPVIADVSPHSAAPPRPAPANLVTDDPQLPNGVHRAPFGGCYLSMV